MNKQEFYDCIIAQLKKHKERFSKDALQSMRTSIMEHEDVHFYDDAFITKETVDGFGVERVYKIGKNKFEVEVKNADYVIINNQNRQYLYAIFVFLVLIVGIIAAN